jgi:hypothetical protein
VWHKWGTRRPRIFLVGEPEGKRLLGRPKRRGLYNINMDLVKIEWGGVD